MSITNSLDNTMTISSESDDSLNVTSEDFKHILAAERMHLDNNMSIELNGSDSESNFFTDKKKKCNRKPNRSRTNLKKEKLPKKHVNNNSSKCASKKKIPRLVTDCTNNKGSKNVTEITSPVLNSNEKYSQTVTSGAEMNSDLLKPNEFISTDFLNDMTILKNFDHNTINITNTSFQFTPTITSQQNAISERSPTRHSQKIEIISNICISPSKILQNKASNSNEKISVTKSVSVQSDKTILLPIKITNKLGRRILSVTTQTSSEDLCITATKSKFEKEVISSKKKTDFSDDSSPEELISKKNCLLQSPSGTAKNSKLPEKHTVRSPLKQFTLHCSPKIKITERRKEHETKTKDVKKKIESRKKIKCHNEKKRLKQTKTVNKNINEKQYGSSEEESFVSNKSFSSSSSSLYSSPSSTLNDCKTSQRQKTLVKHSPKFNVTTNTKTANFKAKTEMKGLTDNKKVMKNEKAEPKEEKEELKGKLIEKDKKERYNPESHKRVYDNVREIVQWVFENEYYRLLFSKKEIEMLTKLFNLPNENCIVVCLRLFTRQHKWYHLSNLCNELNLGIDGSDLKNLLQTLVENHFVDTDYSSEPIHNLLNNLPKNDIKDICTAFRLKVPPQKSAMVIKLLENSAAQSTLCFSRTSRDILRDRINVKMGLCVRLNSEMRDILSRVHILYSFTNSDLESIYHIYDLMYKLHNDILKFPKVVISHVDLFTSRSYFIKYVEAYKMRYELLDKIAQKNTLAEYTLCAEAYKRLADLLTCVDMVNTDKNKPVYLRRFSAGWLYCNILSLGSQNLGELYTKEVCDWINEMLNQDVYCLHKRGWWYNQMAMILQTYLRDIKGAVKYINNGLLDKLVTEVDKHELSIRGSKIKKPKLDQLELDVLQQNLLPNIDPLPSRTIQANVVHNNEAGRKKMYVRNTVNGKEYSSVEETAISFYKEDGLYTDGIHCEGRLFHTLFFILFWDIIFYDKVPDVFLTKLQCYPLDLLSGEFYSNRVTKINARLTEIGESWSYDTVCLFISTILEQNAEEISSVISNDFIDERQLHTFVRCIGKKVLAAVCKRLAQHYKQFRSGLPDLFLWNSKELKASFVEVKSEKDKLSTNQLLWLNYLRSFNARVEVCHVQSIGSNVRKK